MLEMFQITSDIGVCTCDSDARRGGCSEKQEVGRTGEF